ncbi:MAG: amino acid adenylation domain-containing protein [Saccharofermentans sp.]|nr:amino acid adenylation domain-containing protein [Saccharofermentans sp.]
MNNKDMIVRKLAELSGKNIRLWTEDGKLKFKASTGALTDADKAFLKENKAAVIDRLMNDEIRIVHDERYQNEPFALTEIQQAYVLGRNKAFEYGGIACHIYLEFEYDELDPVKAQTAWNMLIKRHPMLRVTMNTDGYQQIAETVPEFVVDIYDLRGRSSDEINKARRAIKKSMDHKVYDTGVWPLYSVSISRGTDSDMMHFSMEFAVADWTSIWNLLYEFEQTYFYPEISLKTPSITFRDYLIAEKKLRNGSSYYRDMQYWMDRIDTLPEAPELPVNAACDNENVHFSRENIKLSKAQWDSFCDKARSLGVTPSTAVMTAYAEVLARWSRNKEFCLNLSILNRLPLHEDVNDIVGDFTAGSLLEFKAGGSFLDAALRTNRRLFDDLDHRLFTGVNVLRELNKRKGGKGSLMPYVFTGAIGLIPTERTSLIGRMTDNGISQTAQLFMDCQAMDSADGLNINLDTRDGVFKENVVRDMSRALKYLLVQLSEDLSYWTDPDFAIPLPEEQRKRRAEVNDTYKELPRHLLHEKVMSAIASEPERLAVADASGEWTGRELYDRVCSIAEALKANGTTEGRCVVIAIPKSRWQLAACLAVLSLGAVYVPVDADCGQKRFEKILSKVNESCILKLSSHDIAICEGHNVVEADTLGAAAQDLITADIPDHETAYIIFTSGSTGEPKGVEISHRAAVNTIEAVNGLYKVGKDDRVFCISQLNFDLSVYDLFGVIAEGGAVIIPDPEQYKNPAHWCEMMSRYNVTIWNSVPALMQLLTIYRQYNAGAVMSPLRLIMLSGDWIPVGLPDELRGIFQGVKVVSLGGATEGGIWSIYHECVPEDGGSPSIPYGKPLPNQGFMVKDEFMSDCPDFVRGELYITGDSLAEGYYGEEELTRNAFITHDGIRMYRTGDTGCYIPSGDIEFTGRLDAQVKLRGHRIELGEVETVMKRVYSLEKISCLIHGNDNDRKLVAVIVGDRDIHEKDAAADLASWLPDYMIPTLIVRADDIPLTSNGKVNVRELTSMIDRHMSMYRESEDCDVELTETETKVSRIICDALDITHIDPDKDLYEEGANSLVLARVAGKLRSDIDPEITFDDYLVHLLNTPNVRAVAAFIDSSGEDGASGSGNDIESDSLRCIRSGSDHMDIIFEDGLPDEVAKTLEGSKNDLLFVRKDADKSGLYEMLSGYEVITVGGYDNCMSEMLELASSLIEKGFIPDCVNIVESETESDAGFDLMYAGNIRFGMTVSDGSDEDEIRSIMEEICMGDVTVSRCGDHEAIAALLTGR